MNISSGKHVTFVVYEVAWYYESLTATYLITGAHNDILFYFHDCTDVGMWGNRKMVERGLE